MIYIQETCLKDWENLDLNSLLQQDDKLITLKGIKSTDSRHKICQFAGAPLSVNALSCLNKAIKV